LQEELLKPYMMLLLCGPVEAWNSDGLRNLAREFQDLLELTHLRRAGPYGPPGAASETGSSAATLVDENETALAMLGVDSTAQYLIRPDGHVAFRCAGTDLSGVRDYLRRWFVPR
jgi:hypothetical protein